MTFGEIVFLLSEPPSLSPPPPHTHTHTHIYRLIVVVAKPPWSLKDELFLIEKYVDIYTVYASNTPLCRSESKVVLGT